MTISFHGGHSGDYCDHAEGKLEAVVQQAIALGFTHYGLSEHMPRWRENDLYPEERQKGRSPQQLMTMFANYIEEARHLQKKYESQIHILVGMETEWITHNTDAILKLCQTHRLDYLVGSVHHIYEIPSDYDEAHFLKLEQKLGNTEAVFAAYYDSQFDLMKAVHPKVIGHFDLIRIFRDEFSLLEPIWKKIKRNLDYAIAYGALFEINARAFKKELTAPYPKKEIIQYILNHNGKLTLGDDSHHPQQVGLYFDKLFDYLHDIGVFQVYALELDSEGKLIERLIEV